METKVNGILYTSAQIRMQSVHQIPLISYYLLRCGHGVTRAHNVHNVHNVLNPNDLAQERSYLDRVIASVITHLLRQY